MVLKEGLSTVSAASSRNWIWEKLAFLPATKHESQNACSAAGLLELGFLWAFLRAGKRMRLPSCFLMWLVMTANESNSDSA